MEYFVGPDVSLRSCALCLLDGKGAAMFERELPWDVGDIADCLASFPHPIERVGAVLDFDRSPVFRVSCSWRSRLPWQASRRICP